VRAFVRTPAIVLAIIVNITAIAATAAGQDSQTTPASPTTQSPTPSDRAVDPSQPDFTLIALPTTLRVPKFRSAFRVTHRFSRPLGQGDFGDLAGDGFGIDGSAQIGLEFRFGLMPGTQIGIHRTSDRTIEFFGQHELLRQREGVLVTIDAFASVEGTNNFRDDYSPAFGAVISRTFGRHGAAYVHPIWINNTNPGSSSVVDENSSFILGVGLRLRVRPTVYLVGEAAPRFGFTPSHTQVAFGIEKRAGGHLFQINFSNGRSTTLAPIARGGFDYDTWFFGFNISRKFF
jgi:Membrane bound beta barrel domain (DUF5777)